MISQADISRIKEQNARMQAALDMEVEVSAVTDILCIPECICAYVENGSLKMTEAYVFALLRKEKCRHLGQPFALNNDDLASRLHCSYTQAKRYISTLTRCGLLSTETIDNIRYITVMEEDHTPLLA